MKLIYIGESFYWGSGTSMSSLYTEDGKRRDWSFVRIALRSGESVNIRPASLAESDMAYKRLMDLKR